MAHLHSVYDDDTHFSINPITRAINNESTEKNSLVQFDHLSERFTFEIPRYIEGHDVTSCNKVEIHYINIGKDGQSADVHIVDDVSTSPEDNSIVIFSWLISGNATKYAGSLNFLIRFVCLDGDEIVYAWHTEIAQMVVSDGMNYSESVAEDYSDVLAAWANELGSANVIVGLEQTQKSTESNGVNVWRATFHNGTTSDLEVQNGGRGKAGERGSYWFSSDSTTLSTEFDISVDQLIGSASPKANDIVLMKDGGVCLIKNYSEPDGTVTLSFLSNINGADGADGADGVSVVDVYQYMESFVDGGANVIRVTLSDGSKFDFEVRNGSKGSKGDTGDKGDKGDTGANGSDYVLTDADKSEIVDSVLSALGGQPVFGHVDANNNIIITAPLDDGTYTAKYETDDGTIDIGELVLGEAEEEEEINYFDASTASLNARIGSSGSTSTYNGMVTSDYIPTDSSMANKHFFVSGITPVNNSTYNYCIRKCEYDANKNAVAATLLNFTDAAPNGILAWDDDMTGDNGFMRISIVVKDNVAITADDIANIVINLR